MQTCYTHVITLYFQQCLFFCFFNNLLFIYWLLGVQPIRNTRHAFGGEQLCTAAIGKPAECASSADGTHGKGRDDLAVYGG